MQWMGDGEVGRVHLVVAGLLVRAETVLLCHRSPSRRWYPNVWDLPGGHVEQGETPTVALARELNEELGIQISQPAEPVFARIQRPDFDCRIWVVTEWSGTPHIASDEHDEIDWWSPSDIGDLSLPDECYRPLIKQAVSAVG
jgi:8-oxo-dGTP diphosphatase